MKTDIETLRDSFQMGYDSFEGSRLEARETWDMYHNRQWSDEQLSILENRGQPKETFNVVKLFARMLVGYYSTVLNSVRAEPTQESDQTIASLMTDTVNVIFNHNRMEDEGDEIKLGGLISGLFCGEVIPVKTGEQDQFGRPLYNITIKRVYDYELVLDPMSKDPNYEDARFLHRFKWVPGEVISRHWGDDVRTRLDEFHNHLDVEEAEYAYDHEDSYRGSFRRFDNYLIVQTVVVDDNDRRWNVWWSGDVELERKEITYKQVKWPYRVVKLHTSSKTEYYGIFREVIESQKAINQALVKIQLMVNTQKAFVESTALDGDLNDFIDAFNRVHGVIQVKSLKGVRVENLAKEALEQYAIIDKALDRIQRILSINDSFLGMAYASDSGRKVKLQQNATVMALRYITVRIESFYELLGRDVINLVKQYFTANQVLRVTDELVGNRFIQLNTPELAWSGEYDAAGQPIMKPVMEQVFDPETGKPMVTDQGQLVFAPLPQEGTEFVFTDFDISIESVAYNDEDERTQLMLEQVMAGNMGQLLSSINPTGYFQAAGLMLKTFKTKYSPEISRIFEQTAQMLQQQPVTEDAAATVGRDTNAAGNGSHGVDTKLPTNTNEAI